jgi:hypothetical protein
VTAASQRLQGEQMIEVAGVDPQRRNIVTLWNVDVRVLQSDQ